MTRRAVHGTSYGEVANERATNDADRVQTKGQARGRVRAWRQDLEELRAAGAAPSKEALVTSLKKLVEKVDDAHDQRHEALEYRLAAGRHEKTIGQMYHVALGFYFLFEFTF